MSASDPVDALVAQWADERPDLAADLDAMATIGRLSRLHALASRSIESLFERYGISTGEYDVLASLRRSGEPYALQPSKLARGLMLSPAGMTNRVDRLEAAGLVERQRDPDDRRSAFVVLTPEGHAIVDEATTAHLANEVSLLSALTRSERRALDGALRKLIAALS